MLMESTKFRLDNYAKFRIPPGGFLHAVLSNDLMGAMERADEDNKAGMYEICSYIFNNLPIPCYGSPKAVSEWLQGRHKV